MCDARLGAERVPQGARPDGHKYDGWHEHAGNPVCKTLHGGFGALRCADHADDLRQHRVLTDFRGAVSQRSATVDGGAGDVAAHGFGDRHGFARDHRFVHVGISGNNDAVDRQLLAGTNDDDVSDTHVVDGDVGFLAVTHHAGCGRPEPGQRAHGLSGAFAGAGFEQLADEHKCDDHADRLEIWFPRVDGQNLRSEGDHAGIGERRDRAQADQRVHFRRAMDNRREATAENRQRGIADDRQHQQELHPSRHRIQHEHGGTEYRNRADGGHNETRDKGANLRFPGIGRLNVFPGSLAVCFQGIGRYGSPVSRDCVRIGGIGCRGIASTGMTTRQDTQRAVQHVHAAGEGVIACLVGVKRQRGRTEGGKREVCAEIGEYDMRRAFAVLLAVKHEPQRHAGLRFDDGRTVTTFHFDDGLLHAVTHLRPIRLARREEEPQHSRRDQQRHDEYDCDRHVSPASTFHDCFPASTNTTTIYPTRVYRQGK